MAQGLTKLVTQGKVLRCLYNDHKQWAAPGNGLWAIGSNKWHACSISCGAVVLKNTVGPHVLMRRGVASKSRPAAAHPCAAVGAKRVLLARSGSRLQISSCVAAQAAATSAAATPAAKALASADAKPVRATLHGGLLGDDIIGMKHRMCSQWGVGVCVARCNIVIVHGHALVVVLKTPVARGWSTLTPNRCPLQCRCQYH